MSSEGKILSSANALQWWIMYLDRKWCFPVGFLKFIDYLEKRKYLIIWNNNLKNKYKQIGNKTILTVLGDGFKK